MTSTHERSGIPDELRSSADGAKAAMAAKGRRIASTQKDFAADELEVVGEALCRTADRMRDHDEAFVSRLAGTAGEQLRELGHQLREKDVSALVRDAGAYARRSPATFLAGSIAAGFLLARFVKSSERHPHPPREETRAAGDVAAGAAPDAREPVWIDPQDTEGDRYAH